MLIDTRQVNERQAVIAGVCIIGAGVAGITIARELEKKGIDTCLLESGGLEADAATRDLCRGQALAFDYQFADGCRTRFLGGSSNCWGGWCRPLDAWDFLKKSWVPHSGWPFGLDELTPFYQRTHALLELGPDNFDPAFWQAAIGRADVRRIPFSSGRVRDTISQFSTPVRFGKRYRSELKAARHVRVFLHANVTQIVPERDGNRIAHVRVQTLTGRRMTVSARLFVLATGGIENARLLLASNDIESAGVGNRHGLVGRFFMDHPRFLSASVQFAPGWSRNKLYDIKYNYMNSAVAAHGVHIASQFALTPATLAQEQLLNARLCFCSIFPGEGSAGAQALFRCKQALLKKEQPGFYWSRELQTMLREPINTLAYGFTRLCHPRSFIKDVGFQVIVEPAPDPESRVSLSPDARDALGMPRVQVDWRLNDLVRRTADRTLQLVAEELRMNGVAEVRLAPKIEGGVWPASFEKEGTWHHMGTTRMHDSPKEGVVDRDCKVHGLANLYVAGSSVFPTAGANFPTITIAALALRLAEHLQRQFAGLGINLTEQEASAMQEEGTQQDAISATLGTPGLPAF
ncbi:MAG: GMC family oxidoreductase [Burkholderiaceae bacterium]